MARSRFMDWLSDAIGFGRIKATESGLVNKTVGVQVEGDEGETGATDDELWAHAPLLYRPCDPDATGHCEALFMRNGDERIVFATKDRRWQIEVAKGEVIVRAMGPGSPAYIHLKPNGDAIVKAGAINLGGSATEFVALANKVDALIDAFCDAVPVANDGGAALQTAVKSVWTPMVSVAATKTKAE